MVFTILVVILKRGHHTFDDENVPPRITVRKMVFCDQFEALKRACNGPRICYSNGLAVESEECGRYAKTWCISYDDPSIGERWVVGRPPKRRKDGQRKVTRGGIKLGANLWLKGEA